MKELILPNEIQSDAEKKKQENFFLESIAKIEKSGESIGKGKSAIVSLHPEHPEICVKVVSAVSKKEKISCNSAREEIAMLDFARQKNIGSPKPLGAIRMENGKDYIFMETIEGFSLEDLINKDLIDKLPPEFDFKTFFKELREKVEKMHDANLYHRDLHKGNTMIDKNGKPVIIDFGDAVINYLSSEDPYRRTDLHTATVYMSDEDGVTNTYKEVGSFLKNKGFFKLTNKGE